MAVDALLFHIDTIVVGGQAVAFEDGSAMLSGAHRFQHDPVVSASGNDFTKRSRVPTVLKLRVQFNNAVDPAALAGVSGVQITVRDTQSGRRALMQNCSFGSMGELGGGAVDLTYNVLSPVQWL